MSQQRESGEEKRQGENAGQSCEQTVAYLSQAPRPEDDTALPSRIRAHLGQCAACRQLLSDLQILRSNLAELELPALPTGFELSLRRRLKEAAAEASRASVAAAPDPVKPATGEGQPRSWLRGVRWTAAAAVLLVISGLLLWRAIEGQGEVRYYRLVLSIQTLENQPRALFDVDLPPGIRVVSGLESILGADQALRWVSPLKQGENRFEIPLESRSVSAAISVRMVVDGKSYPSRVRLNGSRAAGRADCSLLQVAWVVGSRETHKRSFSR